MADESNENAHLNTSEAEQINWKPFWLRYIVPLAVVVLGILAYYYLPWRQWVEKDPYPMGVMERRKPFRYKGSFNRDFNDLNDLQIKAARHIGIEPAETREVLYERQLLQEVGDSENYLIDDLTHSSPLLVKQAATLLEEIGYTFKNRLLQDTLPLYIPIVTSITRTKEDVQDLRVGNANASENSTHMYGTTFDISWKRYHKVDRDDPRSIDDEELKHLLAIVLRQLQKEGRCYVKHERKQACFHITTIS